MKKSREWLGHLRTGSYPKDKEEAVAYAAWLFWLGRTALTEKVIRHAAKLFWGTPDRPNLYGYSDGFRHLVYIAMFDEILTDIENGQAGRWSARQWSSAWWIYRQAGDQEISEQPRFEEAFGMALTSAGFDNAYVTCRDRSLLTQELLWILISGATSFHQCQIADAFLGEQQETSNVMRAALARKMLEVAVSCDELLLATEAIARVDPSRADFALKRVAERLEGESLPTVRQAVRVRRLALELNASSIAGRALEVMKWVDWRKCLSATFEELLSGKNPDVGGISLLCAELKHKGPKRTNPAFRDAVRAYSMISTHSQTLADKICEAIADSKPARKWILDELRHACSRTDYSEGREGGREATISLLICLLDRKLSPAEATALLLLRYTDPSALDMIWSSLHCAIGRATSARQCVAIAQACGGVATDELRAAALLKALSLANNEADLATVLDAIELPGEDKDNLTVAVRRRIGEILSITVTA